MKTDFKSMAEFAKAINSVGSQMGRAVGKAGVSVISRRVHAIATERTPVGSGRDKHPGLMQKSWQMGEEKDGGAEIEQKVGNVAPHAKVIDRGRKRSKAVKAKARKNKRGKLLKEKGKMLGSEKAPRGVRAPTIRQIFREREALTAKIVTEAEKSL